MSTVRTARSPDGLSARIRLATRQVHSKAEGTRFIRGFLRGAADVQSYTRLLSALHPVYEAMEGELTRLFRRVPELAPFHTPELFRLPSLERDLRFLAGPDWRRDNPPIQPGVAYAERIREVGREQPVRLVGHLYTRYLGDLAGGQVLARIAERSLGLGLGTGLDFYEFTAISDITEAKEQFRDRLDSLGAACPQAIELVIDEAVRSFRHNIAIFEKLEGNALLCLLRNLPLPGLRAQRYTPRPWTAVAPAR